MRTNYVFTGYYSEANGKGERYYDHEMRSVKTWDKSGGGTLYACYVRNKVTILKEPGSTSVNEGQVVSVHFSSESAYISNAEIATLKVCGYSNYAIVTVRYYMREIDNGWQEISVKYWDGHGTETWDDDSWSIWSQNTMKEHGRGIEGAYKTWEWETFTSQPLNIYLIQTQLLVSFSAHGTNSDKFEFSKVEITIEMIK
jgi:hypothetical protein